MGDVWKHGVSSLGSFPSPCPFQSHPVLSIPPFAATLPGSSSHLRSLTSIPEAHIATHEDIDTNTKYSLCHPNSHRHFLTQPHTLIVIHTVTVRQQSPTHNLEDRQAHTQKVPKSSRVTKPFTLNTQSQTMMQIHTITTVHTWSHTQSHKVSHTDRYRAIQSHTERNRHTQLHTGPWRHRTMGALSGLAAAGEEGAAVWTEEAVGAAVPTPFTPTAS